VADDVRDGVWHRLLLAASQTARERRCRSASRRLLRSAHMQIVGDVGMLSHRCDAAAVQGRPRCLKGPQVCELAASLQPRAWQFFGALQQLRDCEWLQEELLSYQKLSANLLASLEQLYARAPELDAFRTENPAMNVTGMLGNVTAQSSQYGGQKMADIQSDFSALLASARSSSMPRGALDSFSVAEALDSAAGPEWCHGSGRGALLNELKTQPCSQLSDSCFAIDTTFPAPAAFVSELQLVWRDTDRRYGLADEGARGICLNRSAPKRHLQRMVDTLDWLRQGATASPAQALKSVPGEGTPSSLLQRAGSSTLVLTESKFIGAIVQLPVVFLLACLNAVALLVYLPVVVLQMVMNLIAMPFSVLGGFGEYTKWLLLLPGCSLSVILRVGFNAIHSGLDWLYFVGSFMGFKENAPYSNLWSSNVCGSPGPNWPIMNPAWIA